jgi:Flp pilus assembly protein TadG
MVSQKVSRHGYARGQRGQAIVLVAFMFTVMVGVLALVLQTGGLYWERRSLQATADAAALASAMKLDPTCSDIVANAAVTEAVRLLDLHLGNHLPAGSAVPVTGDCGGSAGQYTATATFPNSVTATIHYPYQQLALQVEVQLSQVNSLQFSAFLGVTSNTVPARAVARWGGSYPGSALAAYSDTTIKCIGAADWTVNGSVYSVNAISSVPTCGIAIQSIVTAGVSYQDFGNLMIYDNNQNWDPTSLPLDRTVQRWLRVDGWAASGSVIGLGAAPAPTPVFCAPTNMPNWGMYRDAAQAPPSTINTAPCPSPRAGVAPPNRAKPPLSSPNRQYSPTPLCGALDHPVPYQPTPADPVHYRAGCYSEIDVSAPPAGLVGNKAVLDAGFYYFNGKGLCMGSTAGAELSGNDVTLMFASAANFTTGPCTDPANPALQNPALQCGTNPSPCAIGSQLGTAYLKAPYEDSVWCRPGTTMYPSCLKVLVYQDKDPLPATQATGVFYLDSPNGIGYLRGTVSWKNDCTVWSNGGGHIRGQLLCKTIVIDSSGKGTAGSNSIYFRADDINPALREPSLVE